MALKQMNDSLNNMQVDNKKNGACLSSDTNAVIHLSHN